MTPHRHFPRFALSALLFLSVGGAPAAATTLKDIQVGIRGIEFLSAPLRGEVAVAVIHDPRSKASLQDAQAILGWLSTAARNVKAELMPILVDIHELDQAPAYRVAIVARGVEPQFAKVSEFARRSGTLTITAELACVHIGSCVLGIATEPAVEVIVSRAASTASGIDFVRAFRMMVKEY